MDRRETRGIRETLEIQVHRVLREFKAHRVHRVIKDLRGFRDPKGIRATKGHRESRGRREHRVHKESKGLRGFKEFRDQPEPMVPMEPMAKPCLTESRILMLAPVLMETSTSTRQAI